MTHILTQGDTAICDFGIGTVKNVITKRKNEIFAYRVSIPGVGVKIVRSGDIQRVPTIEDYTWASAKVWSVAAIKSSSIQGKS